MVKQEIKTQTKILEDEVHFGEPIKSSLWPSNMPSKIDLENHQNKIEEDRIEDGGKMLDDDEKMLEDDIDRMIAEMQNRPYDSSRYVENPEPVHK